MYEYKAERKNKTAAMTTLFASGIAAICLFCGGLFGTFRGIAEVVGLLAVAFAILVASRYLLKDYVYCLDKTEEGGVDLTVTELQGKRRIVVCRIGLEDVEELLVETPETRKELRERLKSMKRYDYCVDLAPSRSLYLLFSDRDQTVAVRLLPDERMEKLLRECAGAAEKCPTDTETV